MRVDVLLTEEKSAIVRGKIVVWGWKGGFLRVKAEGMTMFEAPCEKVLGIAVTEPA